MIAFSILSNLVFCNLEFRSLNSIWSKQFSIFLVRCSAHTCSSSFAINKPLEKEGA